MLFIVVKKFFLTSCVYFAKVDQLFTTQIDTDQRAN